MEALGKSVDSHSTSVRDAPSVMQELTKRLSRASSGFRSSCSRLDSPFLGGVGLLASLPGVVDRDRVLFLKHDPGPVESRLKVGPTAAHEKSQKIIQTLTATRFRRDSREAGLAGSLTGN